MLLAEALDGGQPVVGGDDLVALGADERGDRPDHRRVVVDDEDAEGAGGIVIMVLARTSDRDGGRQGDDEARARAGRPARTTGGRPSIRPGAWRRTARCPEPRAVCVSRRAYGSKIRSRHSSGMPGPSSETPSWTTPSTSAQSIRDRRLRRGVLHGVLDEVLEDLAEARRVGQARGAGRSARSRRRWRSRIGRSELDDLVDQRRRRRSGVTDGRRLRARPGPRRGSSRRGGRAARSARASASCHAARGLAPGRGRATRGRRAAARRRAGRRRRGRPRAASAARG